MGEYLAHACVLAAVFLAAMLRVSHRQTRARVLAGIHDDDSFWRGNANGVVSSVMVAVAVQAVCEVFGG